MLRYGSYDEWPLGLQQLYCQASAAPQSVPLDVSNVAAPIAVVGVPDLQRVKLGLLQPQLPVVQLDNAGASAIEAEPEPEQPEPEPTKEMLLEKQKLDAREKAARAAELELLAAQAAREAAMSKMFYSTVRKQFERLRPAFTKKQSKKLNASTSGLKLLQSPGSSSLSSLPSPMTPKFEPSPPFVVVNPTAARGRQ